MLGYAASSYAGMLTGLITGPIVARALSPSGRGEYAAVMVFSGFAIIALALGTSASAIYVLSNKQMSEARVVGALITIAALITPFALAAAAFVATVVLADLSTTSRIGVAVFMALAPIGVLSLGMTSIFLVRGALGDLSVLRLLPLAIGLVGVLGLAIAGELTLFSYLLVTLVGSLITIFETLRRMRVRPEFGGGVRPMLRVGVRAHAGTLANAANSQLDQIVMAPALGPSSLGIYAISVSLSNLPTGLTQAIGAHTISNVSHPETIVDFPRASRTFRLTLVLSVVLCAGLMVVAPVLIPVLYGDAFSGAIVPLLLLMPGVIALSLGGVLGAWLIMLGRPGVTSIAQLIGVGVTVLGLWLFLGPAGIKAAAGVSSVAYIVRAVVQILVLRRLGLQDLRPRWVDVRDAITFATVQLRRSVRPGPTT